ncbi:MAG: hypothetical protein Q4D74_10490 [Comamonadaceae bacterium]|nr:hypothetical protein [Comamonadaceae bacterium]
MSSARGGIQAVCAGLAAALLAALAGFSGWLWQAGQAPLLLAPAVGGLNPCLSLGDAGAPADAACTGAQGSAAARIEQVLQALGPPASADGRFRLGYTLVVPLLNLFEPDGAGHWAVDQDALARIARTIEGVPRPVVLYLFSTHFSEGAPIEPALAQDARNLAAGPAGPLPVDRYLGAPLYPWSIASTSNPLTQRREQAIDAVSAALCRLPAAARARIAGINLLGEVHHLYPDFEAGMGYGRPYVITDYSAASRQGFQRYLARRFHGDVGALNRWLGASFASFGQIEPPGRDIRRERLDHFWQHIDAAAAGRLAIGGWAHDGHLPPGAPAWVRVYLNGQPVARVRAQFVRQDVADARPELGTAKVGWRHDLPFAALPAGLHRIDVALEGAQGLLHLGTRRVAVMDRQQSPPAPRPMTALPPMRPPGPSVAFWIDAPADQSDVYYNPLAPLWHDYRATQVVDYLAHFDRRLAAGCLGQVPRRTQQIYPAEKAGWDETRFASAASLRPFGQVGLGINLYGEAAYDDSFFDWLARSRHSGYSVTEFHPLRAMRADELRRVLERHRTHGARTLSFFLHPPESRDGALVQPNPFAFDPANPRHGSDVLYRAVQEVMRAPD